METNNQEASSTADREIAITRILDAPRELVYEVWTKPEHIAQWWGPNGFTNTVHNMEVKVGGEWRLTMHGPDGIDYPNLIIFKEIIAPEKLVYIQGNRQISNFIMQDVDIILHHAKLVGVAI